MLQLASLLAAKKKTVMGTHNFVSVMSCVMVWVTVAMTLMTFVPCQVYTSQCM